MTPLSLLALFTEEVRNIGVSRLRGTVSSIQAALCFAIDTAIECLVLGLWRKE